MTILCVCTAIGAAMQIVFSKEIQKDISMGIMIGGIVFIVNMLCILLKQKENGKFEKMSGILYKTGAEYGK